MIAAGDTASTSRYLGQEVRATESRAPDLFETATAVFPATLGQPAQLLIASVEPDAYEVVRPIPVHLAVSDPGWIASFYDANLHASGETQGDALENLKSVIADVFEMLSKLEPTQLGKEPTRQLAVLRTFIRPLSPFERLWRSVKQAVLYP